MFYDANAFNQTLSCWDFITHVNTENMLSSSPAASLTHYITKTGFSPTNTGAATLGAKDSDDSDCACPPGSYINNSTCTSCSAGTVSTEGNSPSCAACPAGSYPSVDQKRCIACARGYTSTANSCEACAAGTFGATSVSSCTKCAAGTYSSETGATSASVCTPCAAGTYSSSGASVCTSCAADKTSFAGSPQCYTASEMFTTLGADVSRQDIVNLYNIRNFGTCSS